MVIMGVVKEGSGSGKAQIYSYIFITGLLIKFICAI